MTEKPDSPWHRSPSSGPQVHVTPGSLRAQRQTLHPGHQVPWPSNRTTRSGRPPRPQHGPQHTAEQARRYHVPDTGHQVHVTPERPERPSTRSLTKVKPERPRGKSLPSRERQAPDRSTKSRNPRKAWEAPKRTSGRPRSAWPRKGLSGPKASLVTGHQVHVTPGSLRAQRQTLHPGQQVPWPRKPERPRGKSLPSRARQALTEAPSHVTPGKPESPEQTKEKSHPDLGLLQLSSACLLASAWFGLLRLGSACFGLVRLASAWFSVFRLASAFFGLLQLASARLLASLLLASLLAWLTSAYPARPASVGFNLLKPASACFSLRQPASACLSLLSMAQLASACFS